MDIIKSIEHEQLKNKVPDIKVGNTVKVHAKIKEGNRERIQVFEGIIIKVQGGGVNKTFTVRKISYGVGVEKTFLLHSPMLEKVEIVRVGKARRAKLFYLRDRIGKAAKTKEAVGARIENKEITIKEEIEEVPEEVIETVEEVTQVEDTQVIEEPVNEIIVDEIPVESAPEEAPAIQEKEVVIQEAVDTVSEEIVEDVKEESSKVEESKEETAQETTAEEDKKEE